MIDIVMRRDKKKGKVEDERRFMDGCEFFQRKKLRTTKKNLILHNFLKDFIVEYITHGGILIFNYSKITL